MPLPDPRGWATIGLFVTFLYVFTLCALNPVLLADKTIDALLMALGGAGGVLAVSGFYFGSSKQDKPPQ